MSDTFDLYNAVKAIARSVVTNSKGLGYTTFDADQIKQDVDKGAEIQRVAEDYWSAMGDAHKANERLKAAKLLDMDVAPYEAIVEAAVANENWCVEQMRKIVDSGEYYKDGWGNWKVR